MQEPAIIYEDPRFLGVVKPAGWIVHAVIGKRHEASDKEEKVLTEWLLKKYPEIATVGDDPKSRPGIVHRLDRDVSGVMIVARTQEYFEYLKKLFQTHAIKKYYYAIVRGEVREKHGVIDKPIGIVSGSTRHSVFSSKNAKEALTEYRVIKILGRNATLLDVQTHTGRTHQIRVHLKSIGHPIVGDFLYGGSSVRPSWAKRLYLHAYRLEFSAEAGKTIRLEAGMPREFEDVLAQE